MNLNTTLHYAELGKNCSANAYSVLSPFVNLLDKSLQRSFDKIEDNFLGMLKHNKSLTFTNYIDLMNSTSGLMVYIMLVLCGFVVLMVIVIPILYSHEGCFNRSLNGLRCQTAFNSELLFLFFTVGILIFVNTTYCTLTIHLNELLMSIPRTIRSLVQLHDSFVAEFKDQMQFVFNQITDYEDNVISELKAMPEVVATTTNDYFIQNLQQTAKEIYTKAGAVLTHFNALKRMRKYIF